MTTQLRLVEPPEPRSRPAKAASKATSKATSKAASKAPSKGTVGRARSATRATARGGRTTARGGRRSASWGEWRLDAGTRQVGRAGVAQARRALEAALEQTALEQQLSQAS